MHIPIPAEKTECTRCGACCKSGGPALHKRDFPLIKQGLISPDQLYTMRSGELARDNVRGGFIDLPTDIIKIRACNDSSGCLLFSPDESACSLYENRPLQCRVMKCWNTTEITEIYDRDRLSRRDIFANISWLWDLIQNHENRCDYLKIRNLLERREAGETVAVTELTALISYDDSLREVVREKDARIGEINDLLFGRPLRQTLPNQFGVSFQCSRQHSDVSAV